MERIASEYIAIIDDDDDDEEEEIGSFVRTTTLIHMVPTDSFRTYNL